MGPISDSFFFWHFYAVRIDAYVTVCFTSSLWLDLDLCGRSIPFKTLLESVLLAILDFSPLALAELARLFTAYAVG